jgi:hypothetical protein
MTFGFQGLRVKFYLTVHLKAMRCSDPSVDHLFAECCQCQIGQEWFLQHRKENLFCTPFCQMATVPMEEASRIVEIKIHAISEKRWLGIHDFGTFFREVNDV